MFKPGLVAVFVSAVVSPAILGKLASIIIIV
jgi:hypothetical protein